MKVLLGDFNAKVGREDIFKPTIGNESLHGISDDNGVRLVNIETSKNLRVKSTMFPYHKIHKYTWTSPDGKTRNQIDHILVDKRRHSSVLSVRSFRAADCDTDHYLVVAKVRERLTVNKQSSHRFHMERFNLIWTQRWKLIVLGK
jgi:endonuclease/exonuclease/phosphatase family metal-dependent hydrolase